MMMPLFAKRPLCIAAVVALIISFVLTSLYIPQAYADELNLSSIPRPGVMVHLSPEFTPALLKGIVIHPENAFKFDFIVYKGDKEFTNIQKKQEYTKLIKYFLASLAVPDEDQWVNLSPYEKKRIIKDDFGKTEMGRDLLAQDYLLKEITASLIYPQDKLGQKFWDEVYSRAYKQFGTTNIPVNTFNKVWIVPDEADIYEKGNVAYLYKSHLKVMLEEDYLSLENHSGIEGVITSEAKQSFSANKSHTIGSQVVRSIILPQLEKEVNEDKNFAPLRQVFSGMILAAWYKRALRESLLAKIYANKAKIKGIDQNPQNNEAIYQQYLKAYKKGVFNFIKEDVDKYTNETVPRKYFSGGATDFAMLTDANGNLVMKDGNPVILGLNVNRPRAAGEAAVDLEEGTNGAGFDDAMASVDPEIHVPITLAESNPTDAERQAVAQQEAMHTAVKNKRKLRNIAAAKATAERAAAKEASVVHVPVTLAEVTPKGAKQQIAAKEENVVHVPVTLAPVVPKSNLTDEQKLALKKTQQTAKEAAAERVRKAEERRAGQEANAIHVKATVVDEAMMMEEERTAKLAQDIYEINNLLSLFKDPKIKSAALELMFRNYSTQDQSEKEYSFNIEKNKQVRQIKIPRLLQQLFDVTLYRVKESGAQFLDKEIGDIIVGLLPAVMDNLYQGYDVKIILVKKGKVVERMGGLIDHSYAGGLNYPKQSFRYVRVTDNVFSVERAEELMDGNTYSVSGLLIAAIKGDKDAYDELQNSDNPSLVRLRQAGEVLSQVYTQGNQKYFEDIFSQKLRDLFTKHSESQDYIRAFFDKERLNDDQKSLLKDIPQNLETLIQLAVDLTRQKFVHPLSLQELLNNLLIIHRLFLENKTYKASYQLPTDIELKMIDISGALDSPRPYYVYDGYTLEGEEKLLVLPTDGKYKSYVLDDSGLNRMVKEFGKKIEHELITALTQDMDIRAEGNGSKVTFNYTSQVISEAVRKYFTATIPFMEYGSGRPKVKSPRIDRSEQQRKMLQRVFGEVVGKPVTLFWDEQSLGFETDLPGESVRSLLDAAIDSFSDKRITDMAMKGSINNRVQISDVGGIDMNAANLHMNIKRDGNGVPLPVSQQDLENIHIDGLVPVILEIKPASASLILSQ